MKPQRFIAAGDDEDESAPFDDPVFVSIWGFPEDLR
jgi:hypothetical protein